MVVDILYIHQDGLLTGSAFSLRNLLIGLDRDRYRPSVLLAQEGPARQLYEKLDIPVTMIPVRGMWTFPGPRFPKPDYFRNWLTLIPNRRLEAHLMSLKPGLVHINDKTVLPAGLVAKRLGIPVVWHVRSSYSVSNSRLQAGVSARIIRQAADRLIAISEDETDGFEDFPNLRIIYNSVDFDQIEQASQQRSSIRAELGIGEDEILVGTVSTALHENRGSWDFIRAAGLLKKKSSNARLRFVIVAGIPDADREAQAWNRAEEAGIRQQLILTGFRSDALSLMAAMDVVVVCSQRGVLGRMPFEAMALGRPVVVTAGHSGRSQVVMNGQTALVVPPANPEAIAEGVLRLLESASLCRQLAQQGALYARQHFDPRKNAQTVMRIYDDLLCQKRPT